MDAARARCPGRHQRAPVDAAAAQISLRYSDGAHNAEALFVDANGDLYLVTKTMDGRSGVWRAAAPLTAGERELERVATLEVGSAPMDGDSLVTSADATADGVSLWSISEGDGPTVWRVAGGVA